MGIPGVEGTFPGELDENREAAGQVPAWTSSCCFQWFNYVIYSLSALTKKNPSEEEIRPPQPIKFQLCHSVINPFSLFFKNGHL